MNRVRTVLALFDLLKKCMILIPVWLQKPGPDIPDSVVSIQNYTIFRRHRNRGRHNKQNIPHKS